MKYSIILYVKVNSKFAEGLLQCRPVQMFLELFTFNVVVFIQYNVYIIMSITGWFYSCFKNNLTNFLRDKINLPLTLHTLNS